VLRVVCRWDLGAQLVKELLDDLKVMPGFGRWAPGLKTSCDRVGRSFRLLTKIQAFQLLTWHAVVAAHRL
jgi:hypothetical protein